VCSMWVTKMSTAVEFFSWGIRCLGSVLRSRRRHAVFAVNRVSVPTSTLLNHPGHGIDWAVRMGGTYMRCLTKSNDNIVD